MSRMKPCARCEERQPLRICRSQPPRLFECCARARVRTARTAHAALNLSPELPASGTVEPDRADVGLAGSLPTVLTRDACMPRQAVGLVAPSMPFPSASRPRRLRIIQLTLSPLAILGASRHAERGWAARRTRNACRDAYAYPPRRAARTPSSGCRTLPRLVNQLYLEIGLERASMGEERIGNLHTHADSSMAMATRLCVAALGALSLAAPVLGARPLTSACDCATSALRARCIGAKRLGNCADGAAFTLQEWTLPAAG